MSYNAPLDPNSWPPTGYAAQTAGVDIDVGLRQYMLRVYNYMAAGLGLTGLVAYVAVATGLYQQIAATPLIWLVMLAPLGAVLFLSFRIERMSVGAAQLSFWTFAALMGLSLAGIFLLYTETSIARVFFITAGTFAAMSFYGYTTQRDLSHFGSFLFMGLIGIVLASLVNIFIGSSALQFAISVIGVIVFTAYRLGHAAYQGGVSGKRSRRRADEEGAAGRAVALSRFHQPVCGAAATRRAAPLVAGLLGTTPTRRNL
jgi:FtsH-binding integral membrane protein